MRKLRLESKLTVNIPRQRLVLLDQIPRGIGKMFFDVMSQLDWNISAKHITQVASEQINQLENDMRQFWSQFGTEYCQDLNKKEDILITFFQMSTKVFRLYT